MASFPNPKSIIFNTFKGIRTRNGVAGGGVISATECQNIEFTPSSYDAGVNIKTVLGNIKQFEYQDFDIIKGFETVQEGVHHLLVYIENSSKGMLVEYNSSSSLQPFTTKIDNLSKTEEANGITLKNLANDIFVFTNGIEFYSVQLYPSEAVTQLFPKYDYNDDGTLEDVTGLALCEQDGSLVIGCNEGVVVASRKGDIEDYNFTQSDSNKAWYQIFGKKVTAVVPYIDALLVFTEEDSTVLSGNMSDADSAQRSDASLGGCMSFESWCKHDKYLFFYDNRQKNVYYYMQNDYGQKVLGEPVAPEVQKFFNNITRLQMVSYVGNNRSEIWMLSNNFKLIFDYYIGEWSERNCQEISSYFVFNNEVYSTGESNCYKEKSGNPCLFDGVYYPAKYAMQLINLGSFSNLKEMEFQPLMSVDSTYNNTFDLDCEIDGKKVKSKRVKMYTSGAIWGDDNPQTAETPDEELWDVQVWPEENDSIVQQVKGKFISNWYYLRFTIRTSQRGDDFCIANFELKGITQETDTTGRK